MRVCIDAPVRLHDLFFNATGRCDTMVGSKWRTLGRLGRRETQRVKRTSLTRMIGTIPVAIAQDRLR
jgi:hypothetical protein